MFSGMWKTLRFAALAAAALTLAACGGGGGGGSATPPGQAPDVEALRADPAVVRLGEILARADALLLTSARARYSLEGGSETLEEDLVDAFECTGARCEAADGTAVTIGSLTGSVAELGVSLAEAALAPRGGFDAAATSGSFEVVEDSVPGVTVTAGPTVRTYGFWGAHGYAALELGSGPLSGEVAGETLAGEFAFARAYAAGDTSGTNPSGTGSATWSGIVEASPTGAFDRLTGSVTLTIDFARPASVGVSVDVPGHEIDRPGWADAPLASGGFSSGRPGTDYIEGAFGGPGHEEAWGVFDTTGYLGAFGAKRAGGQ